jgi:hypothetical protein
MIVHAMWEHDASIYRALLEAPGERQSVDYKRSMPFAPNDEFSLKLIRHIHGMANAGGGWIVIGYDEPEPGRLVPDPAHTDAICANYEVTELSRRADATVERGQQFKLTVRFELNPGTGLRYPIVRVEGFDRLPYICRSDLRADPGDPPILRQGFIYLRRPRAETSPATSLADWEEIISRSVRLRRDEFVGELREMLERLTTPALQPEGSGEFESFLLGQRNRALNG